MKLRVVIAADHGGLTLKNGLLKRLETECDITDLGAYQRDDEDDYPDFSEAVAVRLMSGKADRGIVICGSGVGACIAANKFPGIRACLCHDTYSAHQGVEHDDMNVLCLGARVVGDELALELAKAFLGARFTDAGRFRRRVEKVVSIERKHLEMHHGEEP